MGYPEKDRLELMALYKQATLGDVKTTRPEGLTDFVEKAEWDAWAGKAGMTHEDAMKRYVELAS